VRYTDGMTSFSIIQVPDSALKPGFQRRLGMGPERTGPGYSWKNKGISLTIIGRISRDQLVRIARSVK
jgi:anti-sigma factor RsiW